MTTTATFCNEVDNQKYSDYQIKEHIRQLYILFIDDVFVNGMTNLTIICQIVNKKFGRNYSPADIVDIIKN